MGVELFIFPVLFAIVVVASVISIEILRKIFGIGSKAILILIVTLVAPAMVLLMGLRDPYVEWSSVTFSMGLSAIISCFVAIFYLRFRVPK